MSQSTLAKTLGVSFQQVQKYEKGINRISAGRLLKMARGLEVPIAYFYAGLEKRTHDSILSDNLTLLQSKASVRMIRAYAKMPPRTQTKLALFIESLSE
jgi:transcriptional regulator with XRE-family HTH domain